MRRFKKLTNYCDVSLYFLKIIAIINNKYFLLRRLSEERVFRMTKKKIEDFLTDTEKEELLENYKCLREARTKAKLTILEKQ